MALPAANFMMSALGRRRGAEDCLTEVLACVIAGDRDFGQALLAMPGLDEQRIIVVETQVATGQGLCTTDMRLSLQDGDGRRMDLWSEHKLDSPFGREQLANYEAALKKHRARGERIHLQVILVGLPNVADRERLDRMGASILSWHGVADTVERVQRARDPRWYEASRNPGASAEMRVLTEFAVYLEEEVELAVSGPLDNEKLSALQNIDAARLASEALLERVADILHPGGERSHVEGESEEAWLGLSSVGWWNKYTDGMLYIWVAPTRWFSNDNVDPVVSFGVAVEVGADDAAHVLADKRFRHAVGDQTLQIGTYPSTATLLVGDSANLRAWPTGPA